MRGEAPELLMLHALPLTGAMWRRQINLLPGASHAPTLYSFGDDIETWAAEALKVASGKRLIVVGCSIGGSCALEVAALAPDRIAALVLIATKVKHHPDPALHASALEALHRQGMDAAWRRFWEPLFRSGTSSEIIGEARRMMVRLPADDVARGVTAFHRRPSREQFLRTFPAPVIVVTGDDDSAPGLATSAKQAAMAPHGRLHVIRDCGHYVPMERADALNGILRDVIAAA